MRSLEVYVHRMIEVIDRLIFYTDGIWYEDFVMNKEKFDASTHMLIQLWETAAQIAKHYPKFSMKNQSEIIGMRNILVHTYHKIDSYRIWLTIKNHIPKLKEFLLKEGL